MGQPATEPRWIETVNGKVPVQALGLILPHEHLFTDLRGPLAPGYAQADPEAVARVMEPYLAAAHAVGVTALVECSTVGVGRNLAVLQRLAGVTPIHLIVPTGVYRQAFTPSPLLEMSAQSLAELWVHELTQGIEGSDVRAGFIKVAVSDDGPSPLEVRNLKAAALASRETGAAVVSHTVGGALLRGELDVLEAAGMDLRRFVWAHAGLEPDLAVHRQAARRGLYLSFDTIGAEWQPQRLLLEATLALVEAGHADRLLLSHDAGWYDPSQPDGRPEGGIRGYTALVEQFIPALRARGVTEDLVHLITVTNPAHALAFADRTTDTWR